MKKVTLLVAFAAAASLSSCSQSPKANMKSDIDSLSYMMGVTNTQGLKQYAVGQLGVDSTYMAEFIKGIEEGSKETSKKQEAYMAGLQIGQQVGGRMFDGINQQLFGNDSTMKLDKKNFLAGFISAVKGEKMPVTMEQAQKYVEENAQKLKEKALQSQYGANKTAGEKFLADNAKKEGVKTTASGLQYKVIKMGNGAVPTDTSTVKVNYEGKLIDGTEFDSSYKRKEPATFRANQVIKGWTEALKMMPAGSTFELYIPQELGYGAQEAGQIKPFSTLIFKVELLSVGGK